MNICPPWFSICSETDADDNFGGDEDVEGLMKICGQKKVEG